MRVKSLRYVMSAMIALVVCASANQVVVAMSAGDVSGALNAQASDSLYPIEVTGHLFLNFQGTATAEGNFLYFAQQNGLLVLDLTDPSAPSEYASCYVEGGTYNTAIAVSGSLAAIVQQSERELVLFDISNPKSPAVLGRCEIDLGYPNVIKFVGQQVYVGTHYRLKVVDATQPTAPVVTDSMVALDWLSSIAAYGSYAYLADKDQIRIFDITDAAHPTVVGTYQGVASPRYLVVSGSRMYCVESSKVVALDLTNPLAPVRLGDITVPNLVSIAVSGTHVYASRGFLNATYILNFDSPGQPYTVGEVPEDGYTVLVSGGRLIIVHSEGSAVYDIAEAGNPILLRQFTSPHNQPTAMAIDGNTAALATGDLQLIDVSNPSAPVVAGKYTTAGYGVNDVAAFGDQAFVTDHAGLEIVDISDPANPVQVGRLNHCCYVAVVDAQGDLAVAASGPGFIVVDISDRQNPSLLAERVLDDTLQIGDVRLNGQYAYIMLDGIENTCRFLIYDLSVPSVPTYVGEFVSSLPQGQSKSLFFVGDTAYYLSSFASIDIVSVANPNAPSLISHSIRGGEDAIKLGDYLFLAEYGIRIVDLYNLEFQQMVSWRTFGGQSTAIASAGDYVYLTTGDGFWVVSAEPAELLIGDANSDGMVDISDVVFEISFIFSGGEEPFPYRLGDVNCDRTVDISDVVYLITHIFGGGPLPCSR